MTWSLLSPFGIQKDTAATVWHAGRVVGLLYLQDGDLLVGSQTGGIWWVSANGDAMPLSNTWVNEDVSCLAFGPTGRQGAPHVFAGTAGVTREVALWVNDPGAAGSCFMRISAESSLARQVSWSRQRIPCGLVRVILPFLLGIQELRAGCVGDYRAFPARSDHPRADSSMSSVEDKQIGNCVGRGRRKWG
jgi:hypothetical protein